MNIPNKLTLIRLLIAIVGFVLIILDFWVYAFNLILIAVILDIVDGKVARFFKETSKQGIFLDVMADKIVIITTFLLIGIKINIAFFYLGLLMLLREYSIDTMRSIAAASNNVISADRFSKIKGVIFMFSMLVMIGNYVFFKNNIFVQQSMVILASFGMLLAYITLLRFFFMYKKQLLD
jgi:CDP-diacylglycerol--glycerol-3-phosphate 3-phosphatidyltransferase